MHKCTACPVLPLRLLQEAALRAAQQVDPVAASIGAVNTLIRQVRMHAPGAVLSNSTLVDGEGWSRLHACACVCVCA